MQTIPLKALPNQTLTVFLPTDALQTIQIDVYQKAYGLFANIWLNNVLIMGGIICENLNRLLRSAYLNFPGDFVFIDQQGKEDPNYIGLGSRWVLMFLSPDDLATLFPPPDIILPPVPLLA